MKTLTPLIHNSFLSETQVKPLDDKDLPCLEELRDVLKKHNMLDRFGITLLHKHFDLADDEILIETVDEEERIQTIKPQKLEDVEKMGVSVLETAWSLYDGKTIMGCSRKCVQYSGGSHHSQHVYS